MADENDLGIGFGFGFGHIGFTFTFLLDRVSGYLPYASPLHLPPLTPASITLARTGRPSSTGRLWTTADGCNGLSTNDLRELGRGSGTTRCDSTRLDSIESKQPPRLD
ncbi:hypothetical protein EX30DRAFT_340965, partial [Ascodesmis nigricans]